MSEKEILVSDIESITHSCAIFRLLADESRLKIVRILLKGDSYAELMAKQIGVTVSTITYHIKKMETIGLIRCSKVHHYKIYSLNHEIFKNTINDILDSIPIEWNDMMYRFNIISHFFVCGRLKKIPVQIPKKRIVMEFLIDELEYEHYYTKEEIDAYIQQFFDDTDIVFFEFTTLGLLEEENCLYRRVR